MNTPTTSPADSAHPFVRELLCTAGTLEGEERGRCLAFARDVEETLAMRQCAGTRPVDETSETTRRVWANRAAELGLATLLAIGGWTLHILLLE